MNWLILLYFLEFGYAPIYQSVNIIPGASGLVQNENVYFVEFDAEINFKTGIFILDGLFIGGGVKTYIQLQEDDYDFYPIETNYPLRIGWKYKQFEIGYSRLCIHPVDSRQAKPLGHTYGGYEEFYIRILSEH